MKQYQSMEPGPMQFSKLGRVAVAEHAQQLKLTKNHFARNDYKTLRNCLQVLGYLVVLRNILLRNILLRNRYYWHWECITYPLSIIMSVDKHDGDQINFLCGDHYNEF